MKSSPKVSVIIAVYNEENSIKNCIDSLLVQTIKPEIILVDDGSTDSTVAILSKYKSKIVLLKQDHQGPAIARNQGAKIATSEILAFADADMTFSPDYLKVLTFPIIKEKSIGTYTSHELVSNWDNPLARCWNIEEGWESKRRFPANPPLHGTDFRAILKSEFDRVGGFDSTGYTDTWSLFKKLNKKPLRTNAVCYHENPGSYREVFNQSRWVSKREYKLGILGLLIALVRTSLPISLFVGLYKSSIFKEFSFITFKIVYDLGRFIGIIEMISTGNLYK